MSLPVFVVNFVVFYEDMPESSQWEIIHNKTIFIKYSISPSYPIICVFQRRIEIIRILRHLYSGRQIRNQNIQSFPTEYLDIIIMLTIRKIVNDEPDWHLVFSTTKHRSGWSFRGAARKWLWIGRRKCRRCSLSFCPRFLTCPNKIGSCLFCGRILKTRFREFSLKDPGFRGFPRQGSLFRIGRYLIIMY